MGRKSTIADRKLSTINDHIATTMRGMGKETAGERLRAVRKAAELTQQELADEAGVSKQAVSAIENSVTKQPSAATLEPVARRLGVHTRWLLTGAGPKYLSSQVADESATYDVRHSQLLIPDPAILASAYRWTLIGIGLHGGPALRMALEDDCQVVCDVYALITAGGGVLPGDEHSSELEAVIRQRAQRKGESDGRVTGITKQRAKRSDR